MSTRNHAEGLDLQVQALGFAMQDYTNCTHPRWWRAGTNPSGKSRIMCCMCGKVQVVNAKWRIVPAIQRLQDLAPAFRAGVRQAEASRRFRLSPQRVSELYRHLRTIQTTGVVDLEAIKLKPKPGTSRLPANHRMKMLEPHFLAGVPAWQAAREFNITRNWANQLYARLRAQHGAGDAMPRLQRAA